MAAGRHDGSNRHNYFQGVIALNNRWIEHPLARHSLSRRASAALYLSFEAGSFDEVQPMAAALLGIADVSDAATIGDGYEFRVFAWITRLLESLHRARQSTVYLQRFPASKSYRRLGISASDWLEYHYAFYTITIGGVVDIALLLTNAVWELGNEERNCRWHIVVKDGQLSRAVVDALGRIDDVVRRTRDLRDRRVHRGKPINFSDVFQDDQAGIFQFLDAARTAFLRDGNQPKWIEQVEPLLSSGYASASTALIERVESELEEVDKQVETLFDALLPKFLETVPPTDPN
jgi:hypothetical protein